MSKNIRYRITKIVEEEFGGDYNKLKEFLSNEFIEKNKQREEERIATPSQVQNTPKNDSQNIASQDSVNVSLDGKHNVSEDAELLIDISGLHKTYKVGSETVTALKNVNLQIYKGEIIALVGPSGSGKSTLLNLIGGLDKADSGSLYIAGKNIFQMKEKEISRFRNKSIGFIFQFFYLQPFLDIQENTEIPLVFSRESPSQRHKASSDVLAKVGLQDRMKHTPNQISGGQMQRVAIARSVINNPQVVLADEPTGNLDRANADEILNLLRQINSQLQTTIIIVTHDEYVASQAGRIIKLQEGEIINA